MDFEELKNVWSQYDKKLSDNLKFNEELLKKMNLNSSKRELQKPLNLEIINLSVAILVAITVFILSVSLLTEPKFSISGFACTLIVLIYIAFSIIKINRFLNLDYYSSPILKIQKDIARLNKLVLSIRKYELILLPFAVIPLLPLVFRVIHNIDIFKNISLYLIEVILVIGISISVTIWINKQIVDKKFKNAKKLLEELEGYEND